MIQILLPVFLLSTIGAFNLLGIKQTLIINQILYILAGFTVYFAVRKIGRNFFSLNTRGFYLGFIVLFILTFFAGHEVKGSRRWIDFFIFNFQTSEIFKPFFILFMSDFLVQNYKALFAMKHFLLSFLYFVVPTVIIFKQPDLGNAGVYFFIFIVMILFSELPKKYVFYFIFILILVVPAGWVLMKDYQRTRIISFFNPQIDQRGTAYNMTQSIITSGSGKFLGRGLGLGTQTRFSFLPENHTDFAFSSLVEQFGFVGGIVTLILFGILIYLAFLRLIDLYYLKDPQDKKNFLYLIGFLSYFVIQILVNTGMNLGLFPITGIALPFISYGGSAFVALMIGLALFP